MRNHNEDSSENRYVMNRIITVDEGKCIRCRACVRVCPAEIFIQEDITKVPVAEQIESCIVCGHCMGVCPSDAVAHSDFPADKVHPLEDDKLPTPEEVMLLIRSRRSGRVFSGKPVPEDKLGTILEAAHRAPTGSNVQQTDFTLVTDPEVLKKISEYTLGVFGRVLKMLKNPLLKPILKAMMPQVYGMIPKFERMQEEFAEGKDGILRGAAAVLFIHTPSSDRFGSADANLSYQNASLMAQALGVGHFYTGFVLAAMRQDKNKRLNKILGIDGEVHAGMAMGVPSVKFVNYIDRKELKVRRI